MRLLWVGDAACSSGFGRATHGILDILKTKHEPTVIGINFRGDPRQRYDYPIYPAWVPGGDGLGISRMNEVMDICEPELVVLQCNPWNVPNYQRALQAAGRADVPVMAIVAVEGKNCAGHLLNRLKHVVFWNEFSRREAILGGFKADEVPSSVIPLGVDAEFFSPGDRDQAREQLGIDAVPKGSFIVVNVNRNQHRKRLDLTMMYFAEWIKSRGIDDAYLYLHVLPGSSVQLDLEGLGRYLKISHRLILAEPRDIFNGAPDHYVRAAYRAGNVGLNTTLGEGHGLTPMEMMACGTPPIVGDYSAVGEWAKDAAWLVPVCSEGVMPDVHGMIGGVPDKAACIDALDTFYNFPEVRAKFADLARERVTRPEFAWANISARFAEAVEIAGAK